MCSVELHAHRARAAAQGVFEFVATNLCGDTVSAAAEITVIERVDCDDS